MVRDALKEKRNKSAQTMSRSFPYGFWLSVQDTETREKGSQPWIERTWKKSPALDRENGRRALKEGGPILERKRKERR
ncbi:hypothetical protein TNCV_1569071 [Trichonephila clavipes]|nr:hypothetical protein TNCV_1569071 [Trichonephila clavipes]